MTASVEFVSAFNRHYYRRYARKMLRGFLEHVDRAIPMRFYCEASGEGLPLSHYEEVMDPRISMFDLYETTDVASFLEVARVKVTEKLGFLLPEDPDERLRTQRSKGDYAWNAFAYGKKAYAVIHALRNTKADCLFWIDSDIIFHKPISAEFMAGLFDGKDVAHFARTYPHTETGFFGLWTASPRLKYFTRAYASYYEERGLFALPGWTDCHAFDAALEAAKKHGLTTKNLSPPGMTVGHVIAKSVLAPYLDHPKGPRKQAGRSHERRVD